MSRLDYVTIGIVVVCIAALGFLLYRTTNLFGGDNAETTETETLLTDTTAIDPYAYDDYTDTTSILPNTDEDADDNQVAPYEEEAVTTPPANTTRPNNTPSRTTPPVADEPRPVAASEQSGNYLVLAGSYKIRENAETEVRRLQKLGYENAEVSPFNRGAFAVVLVNRFDNVADARALVQELKGKGVDSYVQEKRD
jgi:cell division septation protein DedD